MEANPSEFRVITSFLIILIALKCVETKIYEFPKVCSLEYTGVVCKRIESTVTDPAIIGKSGETCTQSEVTFEDSKLSLIPGNLFKFFTHLEGLHLHNCQVRYIRISNFQNSTKLKYLDLSSNRIDSLPSEAFLFAPTLMHLSLSHNELRNFEWDSFRPLIQLQRLYLNNNKITKLPREVFKTMPNLQQIFLGGNQIEVIENEIFEGNPLLEKIDLKENRIKAIEKRSLTHFKHLVWLDVSNNMFEELETGSVAELHANKGIIKTCKILGSVSHLYANDNRLQNISIQDLNFSKVIHLRSNSIFDISNLIGATELHDFDISQNPINELSASVLQNMTQLRYLNLSSVNLKYLHEDFLLSQSHLQTLDLSNNFLENIELKVIKNMKALQAIYFDGNRIHEFQFSSLKDHLPWLREIGLSRNPWNCAYFYNLLEYLEAHNIRLRNNDSQECTNLPSISDQMTVVHDDYSLEAMNSNICPNFNESISALVDPIVEEIEVIKMLLEELRETFTSRLDTILEVVKYRMDITQH